MADDNVSLDVPPSVKQRFSWSTPTKIIAGIIVAIVIAGGVGAGSFALMHRAPTIQTQRVARGNVERTIIVNATVANPNYVVAFRSNGTIATIVVKVGEPVIEGEIIATLDTESFQAALDATQSALSTAQSDSDEAQSSLADAQTQSQAQVDAAFASEQQALDACNGDAACVQTAETQYIIAENAAKTLLLTAQQRASTATSELQAAQSQFDAAQTALDGATLKAPHAGTIATLNANIGASAGPSIPTVTVIDTLDIGFNALLTPAQALDTKPGEPVSSEIDGQTIHGKTGYLSPVGEGTGEALRYPLAITLDDGASDSIFLLPGMNVTTTLYPLQRMSVLFISTKAVTYAASSAGKHHIGSAAWDAAFTEAQINVRALPSDQLTPLNGQVTPSVVITYINGKWQAIPVVLGPSANGRVEVVSGLTENLAVVVGES